MSMKQPGQQLPKSEAMKRFEDAQRRQKLARLKLKSGNSVADTKTPTPKSARKRRRKRSR